MRELLSQSRKLTYYRNKHDTEDREKREYTLEWKEDGMVVEHGFGGRFDDYIDRRYSMLS